MTNFYQKNSAYLLGLLTILCWATLATLGRLLNHHPPFFILSLSFLIASIPSFFLKQKLFVSLGEFSWGVFGYFLYHFFLFFSFRLIPAEVANLINYLWPTFTVLFSAIAFGRKLSRAHLIGAIFAICGCVFLTIDQITKQQGVNLWGYFLALGAALIWPIYSVGRQKFRFHNLGSIGGHCLGTSVLCGLVHLYLGPSVVLETKDLILIFLMGIGPFGIGFYTWDLALQKGDGRMLGALSNLTPALSTLFLITFTGIIVNYKIFIGLFLIVLGSFIGSLLPRKINVQ
jgi:drug/metabolite transporter (DMT)-like permease